MEEEKKYSEIHEQFAFQLGFNEVYNLIKNKRDLGKNSKIYIEWTKEYFKDLTNSIDSQLGDRKYSKLFTKSHLKDILQCFEKEFPKTIREILQLKIDFSSLADKLGDLESNPQEFYKTEYSKKISDSLERLILFYENLEKIQSDKRLKDDD